MAGGGGRIWIQGGGELASGVAWRLVRARYRVVVAEVPRPRVVRRLVAFAEVVHGTPVAVEGIPGRLSEPAAAEFLPGVVTVLIDPAANMLERLAPDAVVDARMTKRKPRPLPRRRCPLIGLGPGFCCGRDADLVVETHRQARMGAVLECGEAAANTGSPGPVGGETSRRLLRAPASGFLESEHQIGDLVRAGDIVAQVSGKLVICQLDGLLRGLIHPQTELSVGDKVGDVDPRGEAADPRLLSDKALAVAGGVLEALLRLGILPDKCN